MESEVLINPKLANEMNGRRATASDVKLLTQSIIEFDVPDWLINTLLKYNLVDVELSTTAENDKSGQGVYLKWKTAKDMVNELYEFYPGVAVISLSCLPIADCMDGSGDPYFIKINSSKNDSPVVRIRHDLVEDDDTYLESNLEIVSVNLESFFRSCKIKN